MGAGGSVSQSTNVSGKPAERISPDEAMSFRGKCSAMKTILYTDGCKLAFMKYLKDKQSEGYLDYYFEIEELINTKGAAFVLKIEELKERYGPSPDPLHSMGEPAYRRNEVRLDIWQNIEMTFSDEPMSETRSSEIIVQLKISQAYALSVLASYLDDFLKSVNYQDWERDQKSVEHDNIYKKSGYKYQSPSRSNIRQRDEAVSPGASGISGPVSPVSSVHPGEASSAVTSPAIISRLSSTASYSGPNREVSTVSFVANNEAVEPLLTDTKPTIFQSILLADDSSVSARITEMLLVKNGHKVQKVSHGRDALSFLLNSEKVFDIALIDLFMPILDGFEAIKKFRESQKKIAKLNAGTSSHKSQLTRAMSTDLIDDHSYSSKSLSISSAAIGKNYDVLVIGMSADSHATTRQRALECGVDFYLQKPFTIDKLARILAEAAGDSSDNRKAEVS